MAAVILSIMVKSEILTVISEFPGCTYIDDGGHKVGYVPLKNGKSGISSSVGRSVGFNCNIETIKSLASELR